MSQSGLSAPASPDPDLSGTSSSINEGQLYTNSRPESRSSISSNSMIDQDQAAESSRLSSNLDEIDRKSDSGEVIGLDENAQSGGMLDQHKQDLMANESSKEGEDSLEMVSDDEMEANESCKDPSSKKAAQVLDPLKDTELDFEEEDNLEEEPKRAAEETKPDDDEEDGECDGEKSNQEKEKSEEPEEGEELEEGEVSSEEDVGKHARMEPRPVCRFYSKGNCTWGNNCRFVHPGVLDKGNYNMFAPARPAHNGPAGPYERPFDRPPVVPLMPPAEWSNPAPRVATVRPPRHPQAAEQPRADAASGAESAWERGLRQAKEMLKKSNHRKETDIDFEEKKLNLGLGEEELDKENDYYTRPASPVLHGDVPPPFEEPEAEPYHKYPPGAEGRWPPSRYPPPPHRHPPPGYPYPYEGRRPYPEAEYREREFYHPEGYDRPHYYGPKPGERDLHPSASKSQPPHPSAHEKRWAEERYVEVAPPPQRGRSDEWWDPWMRSRSPGAGGVPGGASSSTGAGAGAGGNSAGAKGSRRRSYSSGSSFSTSSSTSSSSSSSYSSSTSRSSRSSASSRSSSQSKSMNAKRRQMRKQKLSERVKGSHKTASSLPAAKHKATLPPTPSSPPHQQSSRKPVDKQRNIPERSPQARNRDWSSSSSRSRSRSPSKMRPATKNNSSVPPTKSHVRTRDSSESSSSSEWESSPHSNDNSRTRRALNRGRRDFAERKELRGLNPPLLSSHPSVKGKAAPEPPKAESKQQIKLTLKSAAPPLKKFANKFEEDSEDDGWEKEKPAPVSVPQPPATTSSSQPSRKRNAESPPPSVPQPKVATTSPLKTDKGGKKSTATRREELLKQLKAVEEAIAKKRSKLPA